MVHGGGHMSCNKAPCHVGPALPHLQRNGAPSPFRARAPSCVARSCPHRRYAAEVRGSQFRLWLEHEEGLLRRPRRPLAVRLLLHAEGEAHGEALDGQDVVFTVAAEPAF